MQQGQRTPNSILRKRANKENEAREGAKKNKLRSRRVSFAPDDELETMHLYPKGDKSHVFNDDDMIASEELAARIPLASQPLNVQQQGPYAHAASTSHAAPHNSQAGAACVLSPMLLPSPLSSMELTNNSMDLGFMHQHQQASATQSQPQQLPFMQQSQPPRASGYAAPFEFTTNITSAVPALSTLVEEDEDAQEESSSQPNGYQHHQHSGLTAAHDMTVSMELAGMTPSIHRGNGAAEGSPVDGFLSPISVPMAPTTGPADVGGLTLTPTSPYALYEMQQGAALWPGQAGEDGTEDLKGKWGFTPGVDDTLEMDRGRQVMGETTYNHVYGSTTTGEITRAMQAGQAQGGAARLLAPNRSVIAATANAASSLAGPSTGHPAAPGPAAAVPAPAAAISRAAPAPGHAPPARPPMSMHQTPVQAAEMTINLLAEDGPAGMWHQTLGAMTGRASVASSKPVRSLHGAHDPPGPESGATTALLDGSLGLSRANMASAAAVPLPGPATRTMHNFTAQLLADGTTGSSSQLQAFMQRVQQQPPGQPAARAVPAPAAAYPRDDLTSASSIGGLVAASGQAMQDGTAGSLDFNLAAGTHSGSGFFEDTGHSLGDFARPPDLRQRQDSGNSLNDFALPPDLPQSAHSSQDLPCSFSQQPQQLLPAGGGEAAPLARPVLGQLPPLASSRAAVAAAAAVPLPPSPPAKVQAGAGAQGLHSSPGMAGWSLAGGADGGMQDDLAQAVPPMSFQDFLGLMEIRFLDDMRRRSSFVQPSYGLSLLMPQNNSNGAGSGAPLPYGDALETALLSGAQSQLSARLLEELAQSVEQLQRGAVAAEAGLARDNPLLFKQAQMCGAEELEVLRDNMRTLKRGCRQRTLLGWKKTRIAQEQAVVAALREAATQLDKHMAGIKGALDQGAPLEQAIEEATSQAAHRIQQLQEQIKAHQAARDHDTVVNLRAAEVAAANERRAVQLDQLNEHHGTMQDQVHAAADQKASLTQQLQQLQSQAADRPAPGRLTPMSAAGRRAAAAGSKGAIAQEELEMQLSMQGLQLDVRQMRQEGTLRDVTGVGSANDEAASSQWSLVMHKQLRLIVTAGRRQLDQLQQVVNQPQQQHEMCAVEVEALQGETELVQQLLPACLSGLPVRVELPRTQVLPHLQRALSCLHALHRLATELEQAMLACGPLKRITVQECGAAGQEGERQLVLLFMMPGAVGSAGVTVREMAQRPACKIELVVPCGMRLLDSMGEEGPVLAGAQGMAVRAWAPLGVARPDASERLLAECLATHNGPNYWQQLCGAVVRLASEAATWQVSDSSVAPAAAVVPAASCSPCPSDGTLPRLVTNPLFT